MKKKLLALVMAGALSLTGLVGCGGSQQDANNDANNDAKDASKKIAMVTDVGGISDQSFNQSAWEGFLKLEKDFQIKKSYQESTQDADYAPNLQTLIDAENDLVWGIGFKMADAVSEAAENYPENKFAIIDFSYGENTPENVIGVTFKEHEASYLVGVIAAKMTKTNKVGFIGGMDVPVINRFKYGFKAGVESVNKDIEIIDQYANAFDKPAVGKAIANQMYSSGCDIIFHAAGDTGNGMIEAAKELNKFAIGVDRDQNSQAPDNVITSAVKRVDNAIYDIGKKLVEGEFDGGSTVVYGLKEGGVDIAPTTSKNVPEDVIKLVDDVKAKIIAGEVVVPGTEEEYNNNK
ncbi:BMP family ABC transporter substrate-binding protein [Peptostreptococcaceae bacterium AGR-M142]